jgi:hypothetical protein
MLRGNPLWEAELRLAAEGVNESHGSTMATVNPWIVAAQLLFRTAVCIRQFDAELADFTKQGSLVNSEVFSRL